MKTIWVATSNAHKLEEISEILGPSVALKSFKDLEKPFEVEENGQTYLENATLKARALYEIVKQPVFADDSGLEVDALGGRPGLHSARYSGPEASHQKNIDKLLKELADIPAQQRTAKFRCVIVYLDQNGTSHNFEGILPGVITAERSGKGGFGYDPVFFLPDRSCTVAQLPAEEKNLISHRGLAVKKLKDFLKNCNTI
ncbi:MAG: RdgB/HAM1 family non-canonical purine NTP pyrophosphatase [Candidatus Rifleibacteriota bacterium]